MRNRVVLIKNARLRNHKIFVFLVSLAAVSAQGCVRSRVSRQSNSARIGRHQDVARKRSETGMTRALDATPQTFARNVVVGWPELVRTRGSRHTRAVLRTGVGSQVPRRSGVGRVGSAATRVGRRREAAPADRCRPCQSLFVKTRGALILVIFIC